MRELTCEELALVDGGMNAGEAFLAGAGAGGFVGGLAGNLPGAAVGALLGGGIGLLAYYW